MEKHEFQSAFDFFSEGNPVMETTVDNHTTVYIFCLEKAACWHEDYGLLHCKVQVGGNQLHTTVGAVGAEKEDIYLEEFKEWI